MRCGITRHRCNPVLRLVASVSCTLYTVFAVAIGLFPYEGVAVIEAHAPHLQVPLSELPFEVVETTVWTQDERFWTHPGVDPWQVTDNLLAQNAPTRPAGPSLSMQVEALVEGEPHNLWQRAAQMVNAVRLEQAASKEAILEFYLNHASYGPGIVGVGAAAEYYLGKPAGRVNLSEAALLAKQLING